jgi:hypothetical protein
MKIKVTLTAAKTILVNPEWYHEGVLPTFAEIEEEYKESLCDDPFPFLKDDQTEISITVQELPE